MGTPRLLGLRLLGAQVYSHLLEILLSVLWGGAPRSGIAGSRGIPTFNGFFFFLGPHLRHMEVPRLGVESELQLLAYATAIATWDLSQSCDLHHSSQQSWILNPLSEAGDGTRVFMDPSWIHFHCAWMGTSHM